jgi:hypothetical protein
MVQAPPLHYVILDQQAVRDINNQWACNSGGAAVNINAGTGAGGCNTGSVARVPPSSNFSCGGGTDIKTNACAHGDSPASL